MFGSNKDKQYGEKTGTDTEPGYGAAAAPRRESVTLTGAKSPGVRRIEAITANFTLGSKAALLVSLFLIAYCYGLDGTIRYTYQIYATNGYSQHSLLATVNVVRGIIGAATQPTAAKISDVFGRVEVIAISIVFYLIGTIVEATSTSVGPFAAGALIYQIGYTIILFVVEVLIGDVTSTQWRIAASFIPASPFIINAWVSGNVASSVLSVTTWQWGIGMWGIIYFVCAMPLLIVMWIATRKAKRSLALESYKTPYQSLGVFGLTSGLFWQLDVVGLLLLTATLALVLIPFTISGGENGSWGTAHFIAPLVVGIVCLPAFIFWELKAKHPVVPFHLLKDRSIWAGLCIALLINMTWYTQGDYLYTILQVSFNQSVLSAQRITSLFSFVSVIVGICTGLVVRVVKHIKPFIIAGTVIYLCAFGVLIHYRGGGSPAGVIGGQVMLGFGAGLFTYPTQAAVQIATKHEHLATITGLFLSLFNVGLAIGATISGAIWTHVLPGQFEQVFAPFNNATLSTYAYSSPLTFIIDYPIGTPEREAIIVAYRHTQRLLCTAGICLSALLVIFACCMRDPKLNDLQSLKDAEVKAPQSDSEDEPLRI